MSALKEYECTHCRRPYTLVQDFLNQLREEWSTLHKRKKEDVLSFAPEDEEILHNIERILASEERPRLKRAMLDGGVDLSKRDYGVELEFLANVNQGEYPVLYSRLGNERRRYAEYLKFFGPEGLGGR